MYYLDPDDGLSLKESESKTVYRYYGGDSQKCGAYVTDTLYDTPEEAKSSLALSDVDWDSVNLADHLAVGQVEVTPEDNRIIDLEEMTPTGDVLTFSTVQPSSDYPGGGSEYKINQDFDSVVNVTEERVYDPDYEFYVSTDNPYKENDMDLIDDELYTIQAEDVNDAYWTEMGFDNYITDSEDWQYDIADDEAAVSDLWTDTENDVASEDAGSIYDYWGDSADVDDDGRDARSLWDDYNY